MNCEKVTDTIVAWLKQKALDAGVSHLVVGVSGGVDSAIVSHLSALTDMDVVLVNMPINQNPEHTLRSNNHIDSLRSKFPKVVGHTVDMSNSFEAFCKDMPEGFTNDLANANSRSRFRMVALYAFANTVNGLVVGTGNKVEDHGVRFFTKYGDGGVDVSPIAELTKTQVFELGKHLGVSSDILDAAPSDGLWGNNRTDEQQIGASYPELEKAMAFYDENNLKMGNDKFNFLPEHLTGILTNRELQVLRIFAERHEKNAHKMEPPPSCPISLELLS